MFEASKSQTVGLPCASDRPVAEDFLPDCTQHSQQTSMLQTGFEPTVPASEQPQTHALLKTSPPQTGAKYSQRWQRRQFRPARGLRQRNSRGYPHQCVSFVAAFVTVYSASDEEETLLFLALEDEEYSRFLFISDRCRSCIIFFPVICENFFFSGERKGSGSRKSM